MARSVAINITWEQKFKDLEAAFKKFDTNGDGFLDKQEVKAILQRPGGGNALTDEEADDFIGLYDENADGKLDIKEIVEGLIRTQL